jgi:hypothetical protein
VNDRTREKREGESEAGAGQAERVGGWSAGESTLPAHAQAFAMLARKQRTTNKENKRKNNKKEK